MFTMHAVTRIFGGITFSSHMSNEVDGDWFGSDEVVAHDKIDSLVPQTSPTILPQTSLVTATTGASGGTTIHASDGSILPPLTTKLVPNSREADAKVDNVSSLSIVGSFKDFRSWKLRAVGSQEKDVVVPTQNCCSWPKSWPMRSNTCTVRSTPAR